MSRAPAVGAGVDVALQRRRLFIALGVTAVGADRGARRDRRVVRLPPAWGMWLFAGAMLAGFGSHGWLMLGVAREKAPS